MLVADVKLPGMGGEELLPRAPELHPALTVIVIGGGRGHDGRRFLGAFGYLHGPCRVDGREEVVGRAAAPGPLDSDAI